MTDSPQVTTTYAIVEHLTILHIVVQVVDFFKMQQPLYGAKVDALLVN